MYCRLDHDRPVTSGNPAPKSPASLPITPRPHHRLSFQNGLGARGADALLGLAEEVGVAGGEGQAAGVSHVFVEQVNADLQDSARDHSTSGVFTAKAAWLDLTAMAVNLTRAAATAAGTALAKARTATVRMDLISVPARIAGPGNPPCPEPAPAGQTKSRGSSTSPSVDQSQGLPRAPPPRSKAHGQASTGGA
jgi:hypothetical protein